MKLRQAKKIFRREFLSVPYYIEVKASNSLVKTIKILRHFREEDYCPIKVYKDRKIRFIIGG